MRHIWSFAIPLATFIGFELILKNPRIIIAVIPLLLLLFFIAISVILGPGLKTPYSRWHFFINPALLTISGIPFSFLLTHTYTRHLFVAAIAIIIGLFFEGIYTYIWEHSWYEKYSLENIAGYGTLLTIFFISSASVAFTSLLGLPKIITIPGIAPFFFILALHFFWITKIDFIHSRTTIFVITLLLSEFLFTLSLLPLHFFVVGAINAVLWYSLAGISRAYLLGFLSKQTLKRYLISGSGLMVFLLVTARWI